jgi:hypothetical protein
MSKTIVALEIVGIKKDKTKIDIILNIGEPYPYADDKDDMTIDDWICPITLQPIANLDHVCGCGALQALSLAINMTMLVLNKFVNEGGQLTYKNGTDFPLKAFSLTELDNSTYRC